MSNEKMKCPDCGVYMNQHAEKMSYTVSLAEPGAVDPDIGGVIEEVHTCPACGNVETRRENQRDLNT